MRKQPNQECSSIHDNIVYDVVIIGGGINGCGCAADAALRGLSVLLCEQDDLASKTSSSSSKLIHGGLRYLELFDFGLVKKALNERQTLLDMAPHLVRPLPIVIPFEKRMRPSWLIQAGLFLYDHITRTNSLPRSKLIKRLNLPAYFQPLVDYFKKGFLFYDCKTDDALLTITNALQAKEHSAIIRTQTALVKAEIINDLWLLTLKTKQSYFYQVQAKAIINAAGPWVESVGKLLHTTFQKTMTLVKGSHIVIPKLYDGEHAYMLQHDDRRVVFVIPYHGYTMIGTTDIPYTGDLYDVKIQDSEIDYLFSLIKRYFNKQFFKKDIVNTWSGLRPLLFEQNTRPSELSREYACYFSTNPAPVVTLYGGKITTYRKLAEEAVDQLKPIFQEIKASVTHSTPLPGSIFENMSFSQYQTYARTKYPWLENKTLERYLETYGTRTELILNECSTIDDLGVCFFDTLYQMEVDYLIREEWAVTSDDILWRRTKLGLVIDNDSLLKLNSYIVGVCSIVGPRPNLQI